MRAIWEARRKIIGAAGILLLVLVMMNLNSRLGEYFRLSNQRNLLATRVIDLEATQQLLETQAAYAVSDQAVEDWARNEAHMSKPGDKVIVLLTPANQPAAPQEKATPTPEPVENWEIWWALFFSK
jgi:cell division protein FtsB